MHELPLDRGEQTLRGLDATHRGGDLACCNRRGERQRDVLRSLIRVVHEPGRRSRREVAMSRASTTSSGAGDRPSTSRRCACCSSRGSSPGTTRLSGRDVGHVRHPQPVELLRGEVTLHEVGCGRLRDGGGSGHAAVWTGSRADQRPASDGRRACSSSAFPRPQLRLHPRTPVRVAGGLVDAHDRLAEVCVGDRPRRGGLERQA